MNTHTSNDIETALRIWPGWRTAEHRTSQGHPREREGEGTPARPRRNALYVHKPSHWEILWDVSVRGTENLQSIVDSENLQAE